MNRIGATHIEPLTASAVRTLTDESAHAVALVGGDHEVLYANSALGLLLGMPCESLLGTRLARRVHPDDLERFDDAIGSGKSARLRFRAGDGTWRVAHAAARDLRGDPDVSGVVISFWDVTEQEAVEVSLRGSEERFRAVADQLFDVITIVDVEGVILYMNRATVRVLAREPSDLVGTSVFELIHPDDVERVARTLAEGVQLPGVVVPLEFRVRHADGSWRTLDTTGQNLLDDPAIAGVLVTSRDVTDRRKAEHALALSEERFRNVVEQSFDLITIVDLQGVIRYVNPANVRLLGYQPEEIVGRPAFGLIDPEDLDRAHEALVTLAEPGSSARWDFRMRCKDGSSRTIEAFAQNLVEDEGIGGILITSRDVTAQRRAEAALRESEERFRNVTEQSFDVVAIWAPGGETRYVSSAVADVLGYRIEEFVAVNGYALVHPDDRELLGERIADAARMPGGVMSIECRMRHADGSWRLVRALGRNLRHVPGIGGFLVTLRDVTDARRAEEALRESEELFRTAFDNAPIGVATLSTGGTLMRVNPAFASVTGYRSDELHGRPFVELVDEDDARKLGFALQQAAGTGEPMLGLELRVQTKRGGDVWLLLAAGAVRGAHDEVVLLVVEALDVSARKRAEVELREALELLAQQNTQLEEADRLKSELISVVSHDLRTPLTSIKGYLEIVLDGDAGPLNDEQRHCLEVVGRNADRLLTLVEDLLLISRAEAGRLELDLRDVDLGELAGETVEALTPRAATAGIHLILHAPRAVTVKADRARLAELLENLLSNAIKFTPPDGSVSVEVHENGDVVALEVADTGVGISAADQRHIFDRFYRTSDALATPGTGLGLGIVKAIAEAHGGSVVLRSSPGEGTVVRVELPRSVPGPADCGPHRG